MTTKLDPALEKALDRAKFALIQKDKSAFLSTILFSLKMAMDKSIPTACTNGIYLKINPDFFMDLRDDHRISLFAHEAWHVAFKHVLRSKNLDPQIYNMAADHVINLMLKKHGYDIPSNWLCEDRFANMSTEEVYAILLAENPNPPPSMMQDIITGGGNQAAQNAHAQQITSTILQAAHTANQRNGGAGAGMIPGEIQADIQRIISPKLSWDKIFKKTVNQLARNNYSMRKFNRRFFPDFYLPTLYGESIGKVVFAVDASGSVTDDQLNSMFTQIEWVQKNLKPSEIEIAVFDTRIRDIFKVEPSTNIFSLGITGRGGTNLFPLFEHYNKNKPEMLVVFSDLDCAPIPIEDKPSYPVVWVAVNAGNRPVNFGTRIAYDI